MDVKVTDEIEIVSQKVDTPPRRGRVTEVIREDPLELRVEWDDGHSSVLYPHGGTIRVVTSNE